ncbi:protein kinase-like domain-containing protein [Xylariomycetidae sp. FL0641]|nr:protein kinase-like domain-containing protein [Xylariomycetidae sp. FL0641]
MASTTDDWRASLSSSQRYDNIFAIKLALEDRESAQKDAMLLEKDAYDSASSRDQYDAACRAACQALIHSAADSVPTGPSDETDVDASGETIGPYQNCQYVASGVTASVYRSGTVALKVIVQTRNIEPHDPFREAKILRLLKKPCIPLLETFRDQEQRFTLAFPYMPTSLESLIRQGLLSKTRIRKHFRELFSALQDIHEQGMIHRDIKPSAILLESPDGPAYLSDFGTAWHPELSTTTEPADQKILDIGTGPYRSPEALFGDKAYGSSVDMWGAGVILSECCRQPHLPLFESRAAHEDGNQLGLILSIFKTIGSPTKETWPEAMGFKTPPFEMYQSFEGRSWDELLSGVDSDFRELIQALLVYSSDKRASASESLHFKCMLNPHN